MKRMLASLLLLSVFIAPARAQITNLIIAAGSPEDKASQAISNEPDAAKRAAQWKDFIQQYASNPMAVAFGNLQLSSQLQTSGDLPGALAAGEKAYAAEPTNFDVIMQVVSVAQQAKSDAKTLDYACKGGLLFNSIGKQKPEGMSDNDYAAQAGNWRTQFQPNYDSLEATAYNAIVQEQKPKTRMAYIDQFTPAFPKSRFSEQVAQLAIYSLSEMKDTAGIASFADKALAANPDSFAPLSMLASILAQEPSGANLTKASTYARRAIELAKADEAGADKPRVLAAGLAHSALGLVLLKQDKFLPATTELRRATEQLKEDEASQQTAFYFLGFAYAKLNRAADAKAALGQAAGMPGAYQQPARDMLTKINAAQAGRAR